MAGFVPMFLMQAFAANAMLAAPLVVAVSWGTGFLGLWWLTRRYR